MNQIFVCKIQLDYILSLQWMCLICSWCQQLWRLRWRKTLSSGRDCRVITFSSWEFRTLRRYLCFYSINTQAPFCVPEPYWHRNHLCVWTGRPTKRQIHCTCWGPDEETGQICTSRCCCGSESQSLPARLPSTGAERWWVSQ